MSLSLEDGIAKQRSKFAPHRLMMSWTTQAVCARLLRSLMQGLEAGSIRFVLPDGRELVCETGRTGPNAVMQFSTYAGIFRLSYGGYMGLGEGYLAGDWSTPSLRTVFQFGIVNQASLKRSLSGKAPARALRKVLKLVRRNSRSGSRRNIAYHYDLGNDFYRLWLDPTMTYSSGIYEAPKATLEDAQIAKYRRIIERLDIQPHHTVLEIGCGWGGFAEFAAREAGASITAITISEQQHSYAVERIALAGLQDKVDVQLRDYRELTGQYDRIVSIEMLEAVGEAYWPDYFRIVQQSLTGDGQAMIQVITVPDERFDGYRRKSDFIQRYIFPGGMLLSPGEMERQSGAAALAIEEAFYFGESYGRTLDRWHDRFIESWPKIEAQGFDDRFRRLWSYYLNYTAAGFHGGTINVGQFLLTRSGG